MARTGQWMGTRIFNRSNPVDLYGTPYTLADLLSDTQPGGCAEQVQYLGSSEWSTGTRHYALLTSKRNGNAYEIVTDDPSVIEVLGQFA